MRTRREIADIRATSDAHRCARLVDNATIMRSRRKPKNVSDIRWRMELRRRLNPDKYAYAGAMI
jgi:hypothetical protein